MESESLAQQIRITKRKIGQKDRGTRSGPFSGGVWNGGLERTDARKEKGCGSASLTAPTFLTYFVIQERAPSIRAP